MAGDVVLDVSVELRIEQATRLDHLECSRLIQPHCVVVCVCGDDVLLEASGELAWLDQWLPSVDLWVGKQPAPPKGVHAGVIGDDQPTAIKCAAQPRELGKPSHRDLALHRPQEPDFVIALTPVDDVGRIERALDDRLGYLQLAFEVVAPVIPPPLAEGGHVHQVTQEDYGLDLFLFGP